jgi:hypothetical protein
VGAQPSILLVHDGELHDVLEVLETMEVPFLALAGRGIPRRPPRPRSLLLTTASRAIRMPQLQELVRGSSPPVWIAFHHQDFLPFRERLKRLGVRYLVQSSACSDTVRLLLEYELYRGSERRDAARLPADQRVRYEVGGVGHRGMLLELSAEGCRIRARGTPTPETLVAVHLPPSLGGGRPLVLPGRVVWVMPPEDGGFDRDAHFAVRFELLPRGARRDLERVLEGGAIGTLVTRLRKRDAPRLGAEPERSSEGGSSRPPAWPAESGRVAEEAPSDRRRARRGSYALEVTARLGPGEAVVMGRDLSVEGIRVKPHASLRPGESVHLALYGGADGSPSIVPATVLRDDGERGVALRFGRLHAEQLRWLEEIVGSLSPVEALSGEGGAGPVVPSRIVSKGAGTES